MTVESKQKKIKYIILWGHQTGFSIYDINASNFESEVVTKKELSDKIKSLIKAGYTHYIINKL